MVTKAARLSEIETKQEKRLLNEQKRKKRKKYVRIGCAVGIVLTVAAGAIGTPVSDRKAFEQYAEAPGTEVSRMAFRDDSTYQLWSESAMNNDINSLLNGGYYFERDGIRICPDREFQQTYVIRDGVKTPLSDGTCSFIQVRDDTAVFRKEADRCLYGKKLSDERESMLLDVPAGESIVYGDELYYINQNDGYLYKMELSGGAPELIYAEDVKQFIVCGNYCVILQNDGELGYFRRDQNMSYIISGAYNTFYFNGNTIAQSDKKIITFDLEGKQPEILKDYKDYESVKLIGAGDGCYYMELNHTIKKYSMDGEIVRDISKTPGDLLIGLAESSSGVFGIAYRGENGRYIPEAQEFTWK